MRRNGGQGISKLGKNRPQQGDFLLRKLAGQSIGDCGYAAVSSQGFIIGHLFPSL